VPQSTPRRLYPRQLRRLAVRFWRQGEDRPRQGFTKNVSLTGAFVSTPDPAGRGERVRLELSDAGRSALLYAVVVHSHRVPAELRRFADSAMGLRFLGLDEVVGPFLGEEAQQPGVTREAAGGWVGGGTGAFVAGGTAGFPAAAGGERAVGGSGGGTSTGAGLGGAEKASGSSRVASPSPGGAGVGGGARSAAGGELSATGSRPLPAGGPAATYSLAFATGSDFLATYRRDLLNGGLFVTTDSPARLNDRVAVDLRLPGASAPTVRVEGRVVQVVDPRPLASGRTAGGMGLELIDPDAAISRLALHVAAYERSGKP
jgi:Tfp pilus assembly protein PilZ